MAALGCVPWQPDSSHWDFGLPGFLLLVVITLACFYCVPAYATVYSSYSGGINGGVWRCRFLLPVRSFGAIVLLVSGARHLRIKTQLFPKLDDTEEHAAWLLGVVGPTELWVCTASGFLWLLFTGDLNNALPSRSKRLHNGPTASVALLSHSACSAGSSSARSSV